MDEHAAGLGNAVILHGVPVHGRFDRPAAEAVAIRDGRVTAIGSLGEVRATMPLGTVERRLLGGALLPAFVDPHQHAYLVASDPGSDALYRQAQDIRGLVDLVARLLAEGVGGSGEGWARLHGYEPLRLAERRSPTAAELDRAMGDRPLHVLSRTFHESVVALGEHLEEQLGTPAIEVQVPELVETQQVQPPEPGHDLGGGTRIEVADGGTVVASHERSVVRGSQTLVLDHYLEKGAHEKGGIEGEVGRQRRSCGGQSGGPGPCFALSDYAW
jgi:hypothetical protein